MLREVHAFWRHESLDGLFYELAIKTAKRQAELAGFCILISDQTLTPYHLQLRFADKVDEIEWLDCRVGEIREGVMVRIPFHSAGCVEQRVADRLSLIHWQFRVGFGENEHRPAM